MTVRYEDIAINPIGKINEIYEFLNHTDTTSEPFDDFRLRFLQKTSFSSNKNHILSKIKKLNRYSTVRDTKHSAFEWTKKLSFSEIDEIQNHCGIEFMEEKLGYRPIENYSEFELMMKSDDPYLPMFETFHFL